jgi:hypothetical protein
MLFLISVNLFSWTAIFSDDGLCDEYANFTVDTSTFSSSYVQKWWNHLPVMGFFNVNNFNLDPDDVKFAAQIAANWWNEAGSEHHLYYAGEGSAYVDIFLMYDSDTFRMETFPLWTEEIGSGICISNVGSFIRVNEKYWNTSLNIVNDSISGIDFITTLTHEFGHLLGLDHFNNTYNVMNDSAGGLREVQEDDKYGVRAIYGKDDQIIKTTRGTSDAYLNTLSLASKYSYEWYSQYETFAKPNIVYQPDSSKGYDYIVTWVESNSKSVKYAFAKDSGDDLVTYMGPYTITGSQTLTSPSIAINSEGDTAVIVYKYEGENVSTSINGRIQYVEINTSTAGILNTNYLSFNGVTEYSKSAPFVMWLQNYDTYTQYGNFIIFWSERNTNLYNEETNWQLKYSKSNGNDTIFGESFVLKLKDTLNNETSLHSFWMPISGSCDFKENALNNKRSCLLYFNEIFPNILDMDYQRLSRVFITPDPNNIHKLIVDRNINYGQYYRYNSSTLGYNYGHLGVIKAPDAIDSSGVLEEKFLITYMNKAAQSLFSAFKVKISPSGTDGHNTSTSTISTINNNSDKFSRTGFSGVFNNRTNKFRFIWIEE